jgi:hypothetical protein
LFEVKLLVEYLNRTWKGFCQKLLGWMAEIIVGQNIRYFTADRQNAAANCCQGSFNIKWELWIWDLHTHKHLMSYQVAWFSVRGSWNVCYQTSQRVTYVTCMGNDCCLELPTDTRCKHQKTFSRAAWATDWVGNGLSRQRIEQSTDWAGNGLSRQRIEQARD